MLADQPRHLGQVGLHHALVRLAQAVAAQLRQRTPCERVGRFPIHKLKAYRLVAHNKDADLFQHLKPFGLQGHDHPSIFPVFQASGSSLVGFPASPQAHFSLDKTTV